MARPAGAWAAAFMLAAAAVRAQEPAEEQCQSRHFVSGGRTGTSMMQLTRRLQAAPVGQAHPPGLTLLVSFFWPSAVLAMDTTIQTHRTEMFAALATNLENPHIGAVHVLADGLPANKSCSEVLAQELSSRGMLGPGSGEAAALLAKLRCKTVSSQPTYADFLMYANSTLAGWPVLLSNADVVFDETLGLVDVDAIAAHNVLLLSVTSPRASPAYSRIFGQACETRNKCIWQGMGYTQSWDAYVFQPPFHGDPRPSASFYMNIMSAEHHALQVMNQTLGYSYANGCRFINAFHWHCSNKMHAEPTFPRDGPKIGKTVPCASRIGCLGVRDGQEVTLA